MERDTRGTHAFRPVPRTGVIYVTTEAHQRGYRAGHPDWSNLGQGQPETGELPGAPPRIDALGVDPADHDYAPIPGLWELREAVAALYNQLYRRGLASQYTAENVAISGGGRAGLTRVVASLGHVNLGHFLPDYTAYEELLDTFGTFLPIPILLDADRAYAFTASDLEREILGRGLSALLLSNPTNPTGRVVADEALSAWVETGRALGCTLIFDEFYSHYVYGGSAPTLSAAPYDEDVDTDPVVLGEGLTESWRFPGVRVAGTLGPRAVSERIASAGSFLDGGCARPMQTAAVPLLEPALADQEAQAIGEAFGAKRRVMLEGLRALGIEVDPAPAGGFDCWGDLRRLPEACRTGRGLFHRALDEKVIVVPGGFFDINPGHRRPDRAGRFHHFARFSFGPPLDEIRRGLAGLARAIG